MQYQIYFFIINIDVNQQPLIQSKNMFHKLKSAYIISMGNKSNMEKPQQLEYYSTIEHQYLGSCQVYSSNKFAACYIIKVITPLSHSSKFQLLTHVQNQQNIYLIGLYGYRIGKNCNCTVDFKNVVSDCAISFWEYLSFSIKDSIEQRKSMGFRFHENQIWHIIKACVHGYNAFLNLRICYDFMPSKILINQQGRIRLDWMHIQSKNMHSSFIKKISNHTSELEPEQFLAPEQLQAISLKQFTPKINFEKANIFSLGMTLLQCMTFLAPTTKFYKEMKIFYPKIQEVMSSKHCKIYSQPLLMLVGSMLRPISMDRPSFEVINQKFASYLKRDYSINILKPVQYKELYKPHSILTTKYQ